MMKTLLLSSLALGLGACSTVSPSGVSRSTASSSVTEKDLVGGFLVARSVAGNYHVVEFQMQKVPGNDGVAVTSFRQYLSPDLAPTVPCAGRGTVRQNVATFELNCDGKPSKVIVNFGNSSGDELPGGLSGSIHLPENGHSPVGYSIRKQDTPAIP